MSHLESQLSFIATFPAMFLSLRFYLYVHQRSSINLRRRVGAEKKTEERKKRKTSEGAMAALWLLLLATGAIFAYA